MLGQAIWRDEGGTAPLTESWYRFDGRQIGTAGTSTTDRANWDATITQRASASGSSRIASGGDWSGAYEAFNSYGQGSAQGSYTVRAGDTLAGIAAGLWGDAGLWYKIAQTNGLAGADASLTAGTILRLPANVVRTTNSAATFRPYDPADAYGDTSPTTPTPKARGNKCGVFGQILTTAVVAAVAYFTAPLGPVASAALVNIATQGMNNLTGVQSGFSFKSLALSTLAAGVSVGVDKLAGAAAKSGGMLGSVGKFLGNGSVVSSAVRGGITSAATQGVAIAVRLQDRFSFSAVAAASASAAASTAAGNWAKNKFNLNLDRDARGNFLNPGDALINFGVRNTAATLANAATRSVLDGTSFGDNILAGLPDVIVQTIGAYESSRINGVRQQAREDASGDWRSGAQAQPSTTARQTNAVAERGDPNDVVVTGIRGAIYRPGIDTGMLFLSQYRPNPRARMGGNGGPPLEDWVVIRQLGQPRPAGPSNALFGVLDGLTGGFFDFTGPGIEAQSAVLDGSLRSNLAEILSIDPGHRFPDRFTAAGPEGQSLRWKQVNADFYRSELAATKYIVQGDIAALQIETLRVYQRFVDQGYQTALAEAAAGTLYQPAGWSREQAIGSRMDMIARDNMHAFYREHRINPGSDINVAVNKRMATQPEGSYRVPDVRVGGVVFDASLSAKRSYAPQIRGFYSASDVKSVFIVRPSVMGGSYALPRSGGR